MYVTEFSKFFQQLLSI